jgi:hypothetical protein
VRPGDVDGDVEVDGDVDPDVPGEVPGDVPGDVGGDVPGEVPGAVGRDVSGDVGGDVPGDVPADVEGDLPGDLEGDLPGDVAGDLSADIDGDVDVVGFSAAIGETGKVYRLSSTTDRPWRRSASVNPLTVRRTAPTVSGNAIIALVRVFGLSAVRNAPTRPARMAPINVAVGPAPTSPGTIVPNTVATVVRARRHEYAPAVCSLILSTHRRRWLA